MLKKFNIILERSKSARDTMSETLFTLPEDKTSPASPQGSGKVRLSKGERNQVGLIVASLDELLAADHRARIVWAMVELMNLSGFYQKVNAIEGEAGRPAIDPRLLVGVWLYATLEGIGSARELARLCEEHLAYRWLMGDLRVNYHTLADFRVDHEQELDDLLTQGVTVLMNEGLVQLDRTAQDGIRVRASAGLRSFKKADKLEQYYDEAKKRVEQLKAECQAEPSRGLRQQAAQERAARERAARLKQALEELPKIQAKQAKSHKKKADQKEPRSSSTDPEARFLQMPAGEIRPAFNGELCIDTESLIIAGVDLINEHDAGQMEPMLANLKAKYDRYPKDHLVDGGFATLTDLETAYQHQVTVYSPLPKPRRAQQDPTQARPADGAGVRAWRERMTTEAAKTIYKQRAATIEWANALARLRGFQQVGVRGLQKVRSILLWVALAHNLMQTQNLWRAKNQMAI
jgi:transposase